MLYLCVCDGYLDGCFEGMLHKKLNTLYMFLSKCLNCIHVQCYMCVSVCLGLCGYVYLNMCGYGCLNVCFWCGV